MRWRSGFRTKATAGFGGVMAATVVVALVSIVQARRSAESSTRVARAEARELLLTQRLRYRLERIVADVQGYLLFGDEVLLSRVEDGWKSVDVVLQTLDEPTSSPAARTQLRKVMQSAGAYREIVDQAIAERLARHDTEAIRRRLDERLQVHREELDVSVDQLWNEERRSLDDGLGAVGRSSRRASILILVTAIGAVLLSLLLARFVVRELARLYEREERAASRAEVALEARDDLLAIIAHDLKSPLSAILMKVELIRKKADPGPSGTDVRRHAESIDVTARRMEYLINSLLEAATIEAGRLSMSWARCEVHALLTTTLEMFEPMAVQKSIRLDVRLPSGAPNVWADRERVLQVLSNLVTNAIKFTPEGGAITLRAETAPGEVRFAVTDTGVDIAEDQRLRVFERYWKGDTTGRRGTGLGLYIARGIVEAARGRIWFESRVNEGTTFFFTLPSSDEAIARSTDFPTDRTAPADAPQSGSHGSPPA
jgi:signal transduction histidine kinase